jgi:serine kinase of HPr protein (carbohydrate metabolism regulator)
VKTLVHATAVVVGTTGIIIIGPSGAGKSSMALKLMSESRRAGHFAALIGDDQVLVEAVGGRLLARGPETIGGMIEIRGSGIGMVAQVDQAVLGLALRPVIVDSENRIPEENQRWSPGGAVSLPLYAMDSAASDPFARLSALIASFPVSNFAQV